MGRRNWCYIRNRISNRIKSEEYENFKKIDSYLYYDTEVFGGINKYGKQDLLGMQEFTITHVDKNNGDPIVKIKNSILFGLDENIEESSPFINPETV